MLKKKNLLIVEDEFIVANDLRGILEKNGFNVSGVAMDYDQAIHILDEHNIDLALVDIHLKGTKTGLDLAIHLNKLEIPFIYISANTNKTIVEQVNQTKPYGFIVKPFREKDVLVALEIAGYQHAHRLELRLRKEQELEVALINTLSGTQPWHAKLLNIARLFQSFIQFDYLVIGFEDQETLNTFRSCSFYRVGADEYQTITVDEFLTMSRVTEKRLQELSKSKSDSDLSILNGRDFEDACRANGLKQLVAKTFSLNSNLILPLVTTNHGKFYLSFFNRSTHGFSTYHYTLLQRIRTSLSLAIDRLLAFDKIEQLTEKLRQENRYLQDEVKSGANYDEIVGVSKSIQKIFVEIEQVAPTDYTVLIFGETGTGKELIARALHNASPRKSKSLVKINCAALPAQLIESELFGHEKGSFTGALQTRMGKFELADNGTIFLDEIGEMPMELQAKLLRVIQEKEFERIGGNRPIKCDARIIAATNRNLQEEMHAGRFRADLFYRLNVFPITLPPLRERKDDLLPLIEFFIGKISRKLGKRIDGVSSASLVRMNEYDWPGNIRELEHLLERAAITSIDPVLSLVDFLNPQPVDRASTNKQELIAVPQSQAERENIIAALRLSDYKIRGKGGAAEILNLKPTTLEAKMARMGIYRERQ